MIFDSEDSEDKDRHNFPHQNKKYFWQEKFSELPMDVEDDLSLSCTFENGPCIFFEGLTHARHVPSNCQHSPSSFLPHQHPTLQHPTPRNGLRCGLPSNHGVWQTGMCLVINGQRTRERRIVGTNHLSTFDGIISTESVYLIRRSETMDYSIGSWQRTLANKKTLVAILNLCMSCHECHLMSSYLVGCIHFELEAAESTFSWWYETSRGITLEWHWHQLHFLHGTTSGGPKQQIRKATLIN